ncbi:MAG: tyrosine--tRNA ligase [Nanoarchaeota archaeon]|nr:tyrosine--tRNA ligase [Nanoarchaeota archaeon]
MASKDRFELIKRNTQEITTEGELKKLLELKKHPTAYVGYAPTGKLHVGHLIPLLKIADFLEAGFKFKFLIANLHAHLDDQKSPWSLLDARSVYYQEVVQAVLRAMKVDIANLQFVRGSDFQTNHEYTLDVLRMSALTTLSRTRRAASEVVRFTKEPKMGGFFYPLMQIRDCVGLDVDVAFGGIDQRGIYMLGRDLLPELGHKKPIFVFTPLLPGLTGNKMSASDDKSKIDLLDTKKNIEKKINSAYCKEGEIKDNGIISFVENFIFPFKGSLKIERPSKFGGNKNYSKFSSLKKDFMAKKLHPMDLKQAVANELNELLEPVRKKFEKRKDLLKEAYP